MEVTVKSPQVKEVTFEDYQKFFMEALDAQGPPYHLLFYRKAPEGIQISFNWDNFIIFTKISYPEILELYKDTNLHVADVVLSDQSDHPVLLKFYADYLFNRGIPER